MRGLFQRVISVGADIAEDERAAESPDDKRYDNADGSLFQEGGYAVRPAHGEGGGIACQQKEEGHVKRVDEGLEGMPLMLRSLVPQNDKKDGYAFQNVQPYESLVVGTGERIHARLCIQH